MIDTVITSSVLILIILTIRYVFKGKINPMVQYGLWGLVALRLAAFSWLSLHPIESALSLMNAVSRAEATIRGASSAEQVLAGNAPAKAIDNAVLIMDNVKSGVMTSGEGISAAASIDWQLVLMTVWAAGAIALALWLIHVNRRFAKRVAENRTLLMHIKADARRELPVYTAEGLDSPCLMGHMGKAGIYVPSEVAADKEKLRFAIAHELCHYRHHDLMWAVVRGGLLAFYWFNPLVWAAAMMSKRDCELACDYSVLREIGAEDRLAYGRALVDLIKQNNHKRDVFQMATTMYGSAKGIKERVTMIAKNTKRKITTLAAVLLIAALAVGCTFTAAKENIEDLGNDDVKEIEAFAVKWADAFSERDADTIYGLCENEELYFTIGDVAENGERWMGWSSPWPWNKDYVIDIEDDTTIHIYYYFMTSDPTISVGKQTITVKKLEDTYEATQVKMKHFDSIESKAEFDEAFEHGFPDFMHLADAYQAQADKNVRDMTRILEDPISAAIHQLNLSGAEVKGVYEDPYSEPPLAVIKFEWEDGEAEVKLFQPTLTGEDGSERQASIWIPVNEANGNHNFRYSLAKMDNLQNFKKISAYMEAECKKVFSPYYELLNFVISDYQEEIVNGRVEAVFRYELVHKNYDRDPDTVKYIKEAKDSGNSNYQQMYDEYLQPKVMNFELKAILDENDSITLYSNIAPKGVEWEETKMSDFIL